MAANNFRIATVEDYSNLMTQYMENPDANDEDLQNNYKRIADSLQETVWKLLFENAQTTADNERLAAELLIKHRPDACFYGPWDYNDWIVLVRDELIQRNMLNFWRDIIVKEELGTIWARDSDYFDDMYDTEPAEFYERAGCVAPFPKPSEEEDFVAVGVRQEPPAVNTVPNNDATAAQSVPLKTIKITNENPAGEYTASIEAQLKEDENNKAALAAIFIAAQQAIWDLLFSEPTLTTTNSTKAAELLMAYRQDACFFAPMPFNQWMYKVRDELFKRKYIDFWQQVIVGKKCGLCSYEDSDYFDDKRDKTHVEFYKSGEPLLSANV